MIFFNVPEARKQLLRCGIVYTLRTEFRRVGRTKAVIGNMRENRELCEVDVERITNIETVEDLIPYTLKSGFGSAVDWLVAASKTARTLYKVVRIK